MHLQSLSLTLLLVIFIAGGAAIWIAGTYLSKSTGILSKRFGLGDALGGMILLAFVTNLPEMAIVVSASLQNNIEIAVGNILGGIAVQTLVLVVLDVFGTDKKTSLTYQSASLPRALEALLVITILTVVILGHQLSPTLIFLRVTPAGLLILIVWIAGLALISKAGKRLPWKAEQQGSTNISQQKQKNNLSTSKAIALFLFTAVITLVAGFALERSGDAISKKIGMQGILFGATILAAATSLPEISTGLASMKLKKYEMAVSDIFGGNAFLPVLFLFATLLSGKSVIPEAKNTDIYLTALAMMLTSVYVWGIIFRPKLKILYMGVDSFIVLVVYALGIAGLFSI